MKEKEVLLIEEGSYSFLDKESNQVKVILKIVEPKSGCEVRIHGGMPFAQFPNPDSVDLSEADVFIIEQERERIKALFRHAGQVPSEIPEFGFRNLPTASKLVVKVQDEPTASKNPKYPDPVYWVYKRDLIPS